MRPAKQGCKAGDLEPSIFAGTFNCPSVAEVRATKNLQAPAPTILKRNTLAKPRKQPYNVEF